MQLIFLYIGWDAHNRSSGHTFVFQLFWQTLSHHRIVIRCTFLTKSSFTEPTSHEGSKFPKHWPVKFAAEFRTEPLQWGDRWPTSADIRVSLGALPCRESALRWVGRTFLIFHPLFPFVKEPFNIPSHVRECLRRKGGTNHVGDFCLFFLPSILVEQDQGTSVQKTVWVW